MHSLSLCCRHRHAFSLMEVILAVAIIGILATVAAQQFKGNVDSIRQAKLESDVRSLNQAIKVYIASGGSLNGVSDPSQVIRKLKTVRTRATAMNYVGFRGSMLDYRLTPVFQSAEESAAGKLRALWNCDKLAFEISSSGEGGISYFDSRAATGAQDFGEEDRDPGVLKYNAENGWIWTYRDTEGSGTVTATPVPVVLGETPGIPSGEPAPQQLAPPVFATLPGNYDYPDFPSLVSITNPNPDGSSSLFTARIWDGSGVQWEPYTGPVVVEPGMQLLVYARHETSSFTDSVAVGGVFVRKPYALQAPRIVTSGPLLDLESNEVVTVELIDQNPGFAMQCLEYSINGGDFVSYAGSLRVFPSNFAGGFSLVARSSPMAEGFTRSLEVSKTVPVKLRKPVIQTGDVIPGATEPVLVTLSNANPEGSSSVLYALRDEATGTTTGFQTYQTGLWISPSAYPDGFTVIAYASPEAENYLKSDEATSQEVTFFKLPLTGSTLFVLDCSGSMAWGDGIGSLKAEMGRVLAQLESEEEFGIIAFSSWASEIMPWTEASPDAVATAVNAVGGLAPDGYTNYSLALGTALSAVQQYPIKQVVFLSDGAPTDGDTSWESILGLVSQIVANGTRVDTLAYGMITDDGRALLEQMDSAGDLQP